MEILNGNFRYENMSRLQSMNMQKYCSVVLQSKEPSQKQDVFSDIGSEYDVNCCCVVLVHGKFYLICLK